MLYFPFSEATPHNNEAMALIAGYKVGESSNVIQAFLNGVDHARFASKETEIGGN